jgi:hypothetical protein
LGFVATILNISRKFRLPEPNGREITPIRISRAFDKSDSLSRFQGKRVLPHEIAFVDICYWSLISERVGRSRKPVNSVGLLLVCTVTFLRRNEKLGTLEVML